MQLSHRCPQICPRFGASSPGSVSGPTGLAIVHFGGDFARFLNDQGNKARAIAATPKQMARINLASARTIPTWSAPLESSFRESRRGSLASVLSFPIPRSCHWISTRKGAPKHQAPKLNQTPEFEACSLHGMNCGKDRPLHSRRQLGYGGLVQCFAVEEGFGDRQNAAP